jgi:hypothetical protein
LFEKVHIALYELAPLGTICLYGEWCLVGYPPCI